MKYSIAERTKYLENWKSSGLSGQEFCRKNKIKPTTFYSWLKTERKKNTPGMVKVNIDAPTITLNMADPIILEKSGWRITLPAGFESTDVSRLLEVLEAKSC